MAAEQDPLWYDREEAEEPKGLSSFMTCLAILIVTQILLLPAAIFRSLKQRLAALMRTVEQACR